jgi:gamma-glutamyl phosphate reductase
MAGAPSDVIQHVDTPGSRPPSLSIAGHGIDTSASSFRAGGEEFVGLVAERSRVAGAQERQGAMPTFFVDEDADIDMAVTIVAQREKPSAVLRVQCDGDAASCNAWQSLGLSCQRSAARHASESRRRASRRTFAPGLSYLRPIPAP